MYISTFKAFRYINISNYALTFVYIGGVNIDKQKRSTIRFPSLHIKKENLHRLDTRDEQRENSYIQLTNLRIKDLSWSDKEVVLRVLFAKMNAGIYLFMCVYLYDYESSYL
jgi:hypothetical protein